LQALVDLRLYLLLEKRANLILIIHRRRRWNNVFTVVNSIYIAYFLVELTLIENSDIIRID